MTDPAPSLFAQNRLSRRRFLQFSAMGAGTVAVSPYLSRLEAFAAPPVAKDQGILVTIQLSGGNDGLNMVVPAGNATYAALRPTLKITNGLSIGSGFALHPSLVKTKARYDQGNVAIVRGVGYQPPDLSHFTSTDIWMHGWGGSGTPTTGWAGRFLDGLPNTTHESLYGVSLHGNVNPHLNGAVAHPSSLPLSIGDAFGIDRSNPSLARMFDAVASFGNGASGLGPLGDTYDTTAMELMQLTQRIRPAYSFPAQDTDIGQQLVLAAHLINANLGIRMIDTSMGGFDTHSGQAGFHAELLSHLDGAIDAFFMTLAPRWRGQVAMMTFSEFGRRPDENGDGGTDHGAASALLVIGDHVRGGLHGAQPSLTDLDGDGDLKSSVDFRAVYATVLHTWLRADDREVLGRTYSPLSLFSAPPSAPPTGTPHTSSAGYWLAGPGGGIHGFGTATKFGSLSRVDKPIVAGASTHTHHGLWLCGTDGGIFSFGDAHFHGSMGGRHLDKPIVAMAATPSGKGYWLCASDGGIFCFGDAKFRGSMGGKRLDKPIVAMAATPSGRGYWLCASDGGIFSYGDAHYHGSRVHTTAPVCGFARTTTGNGYWMTARDGMVAHFGDAPSLGRVHAHTAVLVRA